MIAQILLVVAVILIVLGLVMIVLDAFSESAVWGIIVVLLAPIFGPIYAFVHWYKSRARNGFALSFFGMVLLAAGIYGGGVKSIPGLADQEVVKNLPSAMPTDEPLSNEEEAASIIIEDEDYDPILSTDKERFSTSEIEPLAPAEDKTLRGAIRPKVKKILIEGDEIYSSIGSNVEVTFTDGTIKSGKLIANAEDSISIEEQVGGGLVSFEHKLEKIRSISKLQDPTAAPVPPTVMKKEVIEEVTPEALPETLQENLQEAIQGTLPESPQGVTQETIQEPAQVLAPVSEPVLDQVPASNVSTPVTSTESTEQSTGELGTENQPAESNQE